LSENSSFNDLQKFIGRHIQSVEQLEILCLLAENPAHGWTVPDVFRRIQSSEKSVASWLKKFTQDGFGVEEPEGVFRFAPATAELSSGVAMLVKGYRERRVTVVEMIYQKPADPIHHFADAFRIRKEK
jgi:hypothetical protein